MHNVLLIVQSIVQIVQYIVIVISYSTRNRHFTMAYQEIEYKDKIEALLCHDSIKSSAKLSHLLSVSRNSIVNWRQNDKNINEENRASIDFWYCKLLGIHDYTDSDIEPVLLFDKFFYEPDIQSRVIKRLSFGSLEIEVNVKESSFDRVTSNEIPHDLNTQAVLEIIGISAAMHKMMSDIEAEGPLFIIDSRRIREWHTSLMQGIRKDAGYYSKNIRIIPGSDISTTAPEDIKDEVEYWVSKYSKLKTIEDIAQAHAHFEAIHPFGDGNGRVGRLIMVAQCLKAGLMPPEINAHNKSMYYATLEHAQLKDSQPLAAFLNDQARQLMNRCQPFASIRFK